jgi:hypothetical protein
MKSTELKKLIKEAVKESIHEELKDILLEAIRSPKQQNPLFESDNPISQSSALLDVESKRKIYENMISDKTLSFNSSNAQGFHSPYTPNPGFNPPAHFDSANGTLPAGEVDMNQIMSLMKGK